MMNLRNSALAMLMVGEFFIVAPHAFAIRAVPWAPGRTVVVKLKVGQTTEIVFPFSVMTLTPPGAAISYDFTNRRIMVKAKKPFELLRFFVTDEKGNTYMVELQEAPPGEKEDDSVEISPEFVQAASEPSAAGPDRLMLNLFRAMKLEKPLAGFQVLHRNGEPFNAEPGVSQMRIKTLYDGPTLIGYILEVENLSNGPIRVDPQQFKMEGIKAASVNDFRLAPAEPKDSVEAFKGYPKKTLAYVVVSKAEMNK